MSSRWPGMVGCFPRPQELHRTHRAAFAKRACKPASAHGRLHAARTIKPTESSSKTLGWSSSAHNFCRCHHMVIKTSRFIRHRHQHSANFDGRYRPTAPPPQEPHTCATPRLLSPAPGGAARRSVVGKSLRPPTEHSPNRGKSLCFIVEEGRPEPHRKTPCGVSIAYLSRVCKHIIATCLGIFL